MHTEDLQTIVNLDSKRSKKKKHKKSNVLGESANDNDPISQTKSINESSVEANGVSNTKKSKKKMKKDPENLVSPSHLTISDEKQSKKRKKNETLDISESNSAPHESERKDKKSEITQIEIANTTGRKKKKRKKKEKCVEIENNLSINEITTIPVPEVLNELGSRKKKKEAKKKKKFDKTASGNDSINSNLLRTEKLNNIENTSENEKGKTDNTIIGNFENSNRPPKKKKTEKNNSVVSDENVLGQNDLSVNENLALPETKNTIKRKKKKKIKKEDCDDCAASDSKSSPLQNHQIVNSVDCDKRNKDKTISMVNGKRKICETSQDDILDEPPIKKKKRKKFKKEEKDTDQVSLVCNEKDLPSMPRKKKKRKLKENDDVSEQENGSSALKEKDDADKNWQHTDDNNGSDKLGQWKTAKLSSSAQQEKFARLLGCAKSKNSSPSSNPGNGQSVLSKLSGVWKPPEGRKLWSALQNKKTFSTMALDEKGSKKLAENLENQYNQTLSFNLQKRKEGNAAKGLGFAEDPAKGKNHYIDIHKVKSVQLD